jgi:hypothetical protein
MSGRLLATPCASIVTAIGGIPLRAGRRRPGRGCRDGETPASLLEEQPGALAWVPAGCTSLTV